jgi:predicted nuclease of predicted toxin-antitoxin system
MSELFARLYLDEDVSVVVADLVRSRGFEVSTAQQAGNLQFTDEQQLAYAAANAMVIVTHNRRDFDRLAAEYVAGKRSHAGIIASVRRPEPQIAARLVQILDQYSADELRDLLLYI